MSNSDKCSICGRRWTDPDCPHGVEGLERVGGVGWVPAEVGPVPAPGGRPFAYSRGSGVVAPVDYEVLPMAVEMVAVPTGDDFGVPGRSRDRRIATERGWAE